MTLRLYALVTCYTVTCGGVQTPDPAFTTPPVAKAEAKSGRLQHKLRRPQQATFIIKRLLLIVTQGAEKAV